MTDRTAPDTTLADLTGLPMQPTGSGVADLDVAYEQMKLSQAADASPGLADENAPPTTAEDRDESEAHPI